MSEKKAERKEAFQTISGIPIQEIYGATDDKTAGVYPFDRAIRKSMYRGRFWTMRQYAGLGDAQASNERYKFLLTQGQTGLSIAFDLPTQIGYDSDDAMALGEVGKVGVAIDTLADMEILLEDIPLDEITASMTINSTAAILLALYIAVAEKKGIPAEKLGGTIQNDILKEYIARGTYIFPPGPSLRLITDIFDYCRKNTPQWNTISISGYHIREAGSTAVEEVAFTLADGIAYVEAMMEKIEKENLDLTFDDFGGRLSFFFNCHMDFFEEVAKFRAARRMWAKICKERFGAKTDRVCQMRFHTQTAGSSLQADQIEVNVVRTTIEAMAAVCGGTQSLHTNSKDEALALPTEDSARIALRTQQVIANESGIADVVDPLGGSYYVEALTDEIEKQASELISKIDEFGGMRKAIESGYPQQRIQDSAYVYQKEIETQARKIVGVNCYKIEEESPEIFRYDPALEKRQLERLAKIKSQRDNAAVEAALDNLQTAAEGDDNLMPFILDAVKVYASVGEIVKRLKAVFGSYNA